MSENFNYFENTPPEIIEYILSFEDVSLKDALNFGLTSRNNLQLCQSFQPLWKKKLFSKWPVLKIVYEKMVVQNWLEECISIGQTQSYCSSRIKGMELKYHWRNVSLPQSDMADILEISKGRDRLQFHFMAEYLRRLCHANILAPDNHNQTPQYGLNTLTHSYYAEIVLDYLCHEHMKLDLETLFRQVSLPEEIAVLFIQWILPKARITKESLSTDISTMVKMVKLLLPEHHPLLSIESSKTKQWSTKLLQDNQWDPKTCQEIMCLISDTLFRIEKYMLTDGYHWDYINIEKVLSSKVGHRIMLNIIFEGIARRCGVRCDIVTTANHVFLYWRSSWSENSPLFVINTSDGSLRPSVGRCPFSRGNPVSQLHYKYSHLELIVSLLLIFDGIHELMSERMSLYCFKLLLLLYPDNTNYLMAIINYHYKNRMDLQPLLPLIDEHILNPKVPDARKSSCQQTYGEIVLSLKMSSRFLNRASIQRNRPQSMKLGIGLICRHKTHQYDCVIADWEVVIPSTDQDSHLVGHYGREQVFYYVIAQDGSRRRVSEDDLFASMVITQFPSIEDKIGKDFSHFNGFRYVPNEEKRKEYPQDENCCCFYQSRYHNRPVVEPCE